ncbi:MAG TPA: radical SAM protein [Pyrinomonadaceae bacterium]|nr:radical SAM protein [Pyrinomonadaceae bacterium]
MTNDVPAVYGPVDSWRLGRSLGVDLLCVNSICSFRCFYCQLGRINVNTSERAVFVPTRKVVDDLGRADWGGADCVTLSGSGEPTLATNIGEVIREVRRMTGKPVAVLTNAAHLESARVRRDLREADTVFCKLDATDEKTFRRINRPFEGITLRGVVRGIKQFRAEYAGRLAVQTMLTPLNAYGPEEFARLLNEILPDEVHLCAPTRRVPREWHCRARCNLNAEGVRLKPVTPERAASFAREVVGATGLKVFARLSKSDGA